MQRAWSRALIAAVALCALAWVGERLVVGPLNRSERVLGDVARAVRKMESRAMQTLDANWKTADGLSHSVKTPRNSGETLDAWIARHSEAVTAAKAAFPPG